MRSNLDGLGSEEDPQHTLLTSETFLELHGEVIAELASGRWLQTISSSDSREIAKAGEDNGNDSPKGIAICDCPLLDIVDIDIELPNNSAVIVQCLSSWSNDNKKGNSRGNTASVEQGARAFIRRLVSLTASGRWSAIHVILCIDVEMRSSLMSKIATLQNAVIQQSCPCKHVTFEFVAPRTLAATIALRSVSASTAQYSSQVATFISDEDVQERARFLLMLVPSMTVHMAARALGFSVETGGIGSSEALQNLFSLARSTPRDLFPSKTEGILSSTSAEQLWRALNAHISHAC